MGCNCDEVRVPFVGPEDAPILLAAEFPGPDEIAQGAPFCVSPDHMTAGQVLRDEVFRLNKFKFRDTRRGNLWPHRKLKTCNTSLHVEEFMEELQRHKFALIMGSEFSRGVLYDKGVQDMCGMRVKIGNVWCVVSINPAAATKKDGVGEFREALAEFGRLLEEMP